MRVLIVFLLGITGFAQVPAILVADELVVDLQAQDASKDWLFLDKTAPIKDGELVFDGRQKISRAVYTPQEWSDVTLRAKFLVEPQAEGVLACGFMVRAVDGSSYYYVHFDRASAVLVRYSQGREWNEIKRVSVSDRSPGQWHEAQLECLGNTLRVSLNGKVLYEAKDNTLAAGRIGFYGSQGLVRVKDIRVTGTARKPAGDFVIPPPAFVHVCEDAGAGGYEAFPDVCRLNDGRLMCVFYAGYGHVALPNAQLPRGGRISFCLSSDEGQTWSAAQTLYDGPDDDRDPSIVQLNSGRILCNFFSLRSKTGGGYEGLGSWMVFSDDKGKTWSEPHQISKAHYCSSPIRELSGGRLILGLYTQDGKKSQGSVAFSDDGGKTWQPEVLIDNGGIQLDAETDLIELKDGTLYAAQRPQMSFATSKDRGDTWTISQPMGFPGHCPYFLRTSDDVILLAFRLPNTSLRFSRDEGKTWSDNVVIDEVIGAYPSMANLPDGSVLVVYYEEGQGSGVRARRFRVTDKGIEWLPPSKKSPKSPVIIRAWRD